MGDNDMGDIGRHIQQQDDLFAYAKLVLEDCSSDEFQEEPVRTEDDVFRMQSKKAQELLQGDTFFSLARFHALPPTRRCPFPYPNPPLPPLASTHVGVVSSSSL